MSSKDKTRQKLVDSMRKTKAGANEQTEKQAPEKLVAKPKEPPPKTRETKPAQTTTKARTPGADQYQSGRRVWPD